MTKISNYFTNFLKFRNLLQELAIRDIKIKYRRSVLGVFWSFLSPLLMMLVLTIIFSQLFARSIPNYPVYLLSGRLLYDFFSLGTKTAMKSIRQNAALIKKVYVPKYIFPFASILANFITFLISLIVLFLVMLVTKVPINFSLIFMVLPLISLLILTVGVGLILSSLAVFFRDLEHLYNVFLTMLMYLTPILYPIEIVPEEYLIYLKMNPLFHIVSGLRSVVLYGNIPDMFTTLISLASSLLILLVGVILFYRKQDKFILYI